MEDKVLLIALKLFLIWLFVMAFCLCICNCLFIRSDRRKTKDSKYAGALSLIKKSPSGNNLSPSKQRLDCRNAGDEERLIGIPLEANSSTTDSHHQMRQQKETIQQSPMQQGQILSSSMLSQPGFGASTQYVKPSARQSVAVGHNQGASDLLLKLLDPPTGSYLVLGRQKRFPRIETASNPALNVEEIARPTRVLHRRSKKPYCNHWKEYLDTSSSNNSSPRNSSSESSITLPLTPSFVITEVENFERPRSSSFSGNGSSRQGSPYRKRISPSPSPIPSDFLHDGGNDAVANSDMLPCTISPSHNDKSSPSPTFLSVQSHGFVRVSKPLSINIDHDSNDQHLPSVLPSSTSETDVALKLPSRNTSPSMNRRSIVSDV